MSSHKIVTIFTIFRIVGLGFNGHVNTIKVMSSQLYSEKWAP